MKTMEFDEVLEHYGVKGMKWGVRRSAKELEKARQEREQGKISDDALRSKEAKHKLKVGGLDALSDDELKALNQRMNLEQQYSNLTAKNPTQGKKFAKMGSDFVTDVAVDAAKYQAKQVARDELGKQVQKQLAKRAAAEAAKKAVTG